MVFEIMRCDTLIKYAFPLINHPREQKFRKLDESNFEMSNCNNHIRSTSSFFPFQSTFLGLGNWITRSRIFPTSRPSFYSFLLPNLFPALPPPLYVQSSSRPICVNPLSGARLQHRRHKHISHSTLLKRV